MQAIPKELRKNLLTGYRERVSKKTGKSVSMVDKVVGGQVENLHIYEALLEEIEEGKRKKRELMLKAAALVS